jgi:hypothetical protein
MQEGRRRQWRLIQQWAMQGVSSAGRRTGPFGGFVEGIHYIPALQILGFCCVATSLILFVTSSMGFFAP